ncbi:MAG: peptidoglycan-binding protein [Candidatus Omnitrophica bacterium]|nr:peptidoglycan-binding protein [Candidatus Omnitrophota bacterium]
MAAGVVSAAVSDKPTPKQIQQALKNAGFYTGKIDGNIGPKTKKAVEEFQAQNGLKADGKVGAKTWKALSAHLGQSTEVANPTAQAQMVGQQ